MSSRCLGPPVVVFLAAKGEIHSDVLRGRAPSPGIRVAPVGRPAVLANVDSSVGRLLHFLGCAGDGAAVCPVGLAGVEPTCGTADAVASVTQGIQAVPIEDGPVIDVGAPLAAVDSAVASRVRENGGGVETRASLKKRVVDVHIQVVGAARRVNTDLRLFSAVGSRDRRSECTCRCLLQAPSRRTCPPESPPASRSVPLYVQVLMVPDAQVMTMCSIPLSNV